MRALRDTAATARTVVGFIDLVRHPDHLDRVFQIADGLVQRRTEVLGLMRDHFARHPHGASALRERPRLALDLEALSKMPIGTLGRAFADHMRDNGLDPSALPTLASNDELEFIRAHLYETHDVWHAVTGFRTDVAGELGLQAFYAAQAPGGLPLMLLAMGFLNTAIYAMGDRERRLDAISRGWAMGRRATPLFGLRWDALWGTSLEQVRRDLRVEAFEELLPAAA